MINGQTIKGLSWDSDLGLKRVYYLKMLLTICRQLMRVWHTHTHTSLNHLDNLFVVNFYRSETKATRVKMFNFLFWKITMEEGRRVVWNATQSKQRHAREKRKAGSQLQSCHQHFEIQWTLLWPKFRCQVLRLCVCCVWMENIFHLAWARFPLFLLVLSPISQFPVSRDAFSFQCPSVLGWVSHILRYSIEISARASMEYP